MAQFNRTKNQHHFWHSPLVLLILFLVVVLFAYNLVGLISKERETQKNKEAEMAKIDELKARQSSLSANIENLNTPEGKEESIRDKFQVVKPGEKMVVIVDDSNDAPIQDPDQTSHGFWAWVKHLFGFK